ncbi:MAG: hypothetical protein C9356_12210 [Oleiphilus sp.]|nr:MAG: hypothetical protein C9356_12210 [Oleiphilus sp.]
MLFIEQANTRNRSAFRWTKQASALNPVAATWAMDIMLDQLKNRVFLTLKPLGMNMNDEALHLQLEQYLRQSVLAHVPAQSISFNYVLH